MCSLRACLNTEVVSFLEKKLAFRALTCTCENWFVFLFFDKVVGSSLEQGTSICIEMLLYIIDVNGRWNMIDGTGLSPSQYGFSYDFDFEREKRME